MKQLTSGKTSPGLFPISTVWLQWTCCAQRRFSVPHSVVYLRYDSLPVSSDQAGYSPRTSFIKNAFLLLGVEFPRGQQFLKYSTQQPCHWDHVSLVPMFVLNINSTSWPVSLRLSALVLNGLLMDYSRSPLLQQSAAFLRPMSTRHDWLNINTGKCTNKGTSCCSGLCDRTR